ncbi:DUF1318 domain-containing protein [candidate division KSB1 bacterium]|nr:DUF1318 domain-containing protein [bacterium]OQX59792.1 MAG: hypothetical protein B5M50_02125 [candidate division KSB1 bacterium 4484_219]RKY75589.1 MAG: DUF1318 domain-containing protein [candidate division KSB1 bacterium]HDI52440.1 DUF1318 domain-containing protein [Bacteroidota bacterium]RKY81180.1 MAG: DUF1318 domain-containing protein [candidate division KSB1 bacterium]
MKRTFIFVAAVALWFGGCSIKTPEIKVTGEKTALEKQVIGTYQEIESDTQLLASARMVPGRGKKTPVMSAEKRRVIQAIKNRKFNKDDIDEFKRLEIVGENNRGFLEIIHPEKIAQDVTLAKRVQEIVAEENRDREIIIDRVLEINPNLKDTDRKQVCSIFAKMNRENSEPGTWIQLPDGQWVKKAK